ncbi:MAG: M48 family metallopeptidase [Desulfuromonadales bacterium]|jgi:STE24 endopeptidase
MLFLLLYLLVLLCATALSLLNIRHLRRHGGEVPPAFAGAIDAGTLARTSAYTREVNRAGLVESLVDSALLLLFVFGGVLPWYDRWIAGFTDSFVGGGLLFFLGLFLAKTAIGLPFTLFRTFHIENRYGFNTTTPRLWLSDTLKSLLLSLPLLGILLGAALWLVQASPGFWWFWVWAFLAFFTILLMYISPYLIEPLFFKFEPLENESLEAAVKTLTDRAGLAVSRVFRVDASRRSRHSNAYFSGLGRVKRIVLFDTLLEQMEEREILAVLAHEVGHWRLRHILKRLLGMQVILLLAAWLAAYLIGRGGLPQLVGLEAVSFSGQLAILSFLAGLVAFPLSPLGSALSRRHEWQADRFASELTGRPQDLASALVRMARENLANLHPHPLYAWFHYSHPPLVERVEKLRIAAPSE